MASTVGGLVVLVLACIAIDAHAASGSSKVFNVVDYGAVADPSTDSTHAFLKAWTAACQWGQSRILVPQGTFILGPVTFVGPCRGPLTFRLQGVIKANSGLVSAEKWIGFRYLDRFIVNGGGVIDGIADLGWFAKHCGENSACHRTVPVNIGFDFVTNSRVHHISSLNSKSTHINVFGCSNLNISRVRVHAPAQSPNTDGIRIGRSDRIAITLASIRTGDDCVSMLGGSRNIRIADVFCGPGHGISIGSLGKYQNEADVSGVTVQRCTFAGTTNGVRIKSWAASASSISASGLLFEDLHMSNVANPIIIDQQYCPYPPCYQEETANQVEISDVTYKNIWGTSTTSASVNFRCSKNKPCRNLKLEDINLYFKGFGGSTNSVCINAQGYFYGKQNPRPCV